MVAGQVYSKPMKELAADLFTVLNYSHGDTDHHGTAQALVAWSYRLIALPERTLLSRLSVFVGSWTLETVEAICAYGALQPAQIEALHTELVRKSLVARRKTPGGARFYLLEFIRRCVSTYLRDDEIPFLENRFLNYYVPWGTDIRSGFDDSKQAEYLEIIAAEHDNLRQALTLCLAKNETIPGLQLAVALGRFWLIRAHWSEGARFIEALLIKVATDEQSDALLELSANAKMIAGNLYYAYDKLDLADRLYNESLQIYTGLKNEERISAVRLNLGNVAYKERRYEIARGMYHDSLESDRRLGVSTRIAELQKNIAIIEEAEGNWKSAELRYRDAWRIEQQSGKLYEQMTTLIHIGNISKKQNNINDARKFYERSRKLAIRLQSNQGIANACYYLAEVVSDSAAAKLLREQAFCLYFRSSDYTKWRDLAERLARCYEQNFEYEKAAIIYTCILQTLDEANEGITRATKFNAIGECYRMRGYLAKAHRAYDESRFIFEQCKQEAAAQPSLSVYIDLCLGIVYGNLGIVELESGHLNEAREYLRKSLSLKNEMNKQGMLDKASLIVALWAIALLLTQSQGQEIRGLELYAATKELRVKFQCALGRREQMLSRRCLVAVQLNLGEQEYRKAITTGLAMNLEEALQKANACY